MRYVKSTLNDIKQNLTLLYGIIQCIKQINSTDKYFLSVKEIE